MAKVNTTAHESDIEMNQQNVLAVLLPAGVDYATVAAQGEMSKMQSSQASIDKMGGLGDAVVADVVGAQEKAIKAKEHADNMQAVYGDSLDRANADDLNKSNTQIESMKKAKSHYESLNTDAGDKAAEAIGENLKKLEANRGSTLSDVSSANDMKAIAAEKGSAEGFIKTEDGFSKVAQNTEFKERSSIESTAAQLNTSEGIDKAVQIAALQGAMQGEASKVAMNETIKGVGGSTDASFKGLDSKDANAIAENLAKIAQSQGKQEAAKNLGAMDAVSVLDKLEGGAGRRGGYIGATRDEAEYSAIGTGKDMEYMMRQTDGDRAKAITKADHISDMNTVSANAAMSLAEDVFGGNAGAFEAVKDVAIVAAVASQVVPGMGKVAGIATNAISSASGKISGKGKKGGGQWFSPDNSRDVEEYLDNNKGARSYTGVTSPKKSTVSDSSYSGTSAPNQTDLTTKNTKYAMENNPTTTTAKPMGTPLNYIPSSIAQTSQTVNEASKQVATASQALNNLDSTSDSGLGKSAIGRMVSSEIKSLSPDELGGEKHTALTQIQNDIKSDKNIHPAQLSKATGISMRDFAQHGIVTSGQGRSAAVDFESTGSMARHNVQGGLEQSLSNANISLSNAKLELSNANIDMKGSSATATAISSQPQIAGGSAPIVSSVIPSQVVPSHLSSSALSQPAGMNTMQSMPINNLVSPSANGLTQVVQGANDASSRYSNAAISTGFASSSGISVMSGAGAQTTMPQNVASPSHARNAFTTPPMAHTSTAMVDSGYNPATAKNAYGDTTNVANTGASSYKADTTESSQNTMEDMKMSAEFTEWNTEDLANTMKELSETIYSGDSSKGGQE